METETLIYIAGGISILSLIGLIFALFKIARLDKIRKEFLPSDSGKNLEQVLVEQNQKITELRADLTENELRIKDLTVINQTNFQKVGFVRFNPFDDSGGNISFAIALLNGYGDGFVISSLHGRDGTRVYSKAIKNGKSESQLTEEELEAIKNAR